jgi:hypothetical protein
MEENCDWNTGSLSALQNYTTVDITDRMGCSKPRNFEYNINYRWARNCRGLWKTYDGFPQPLLIESLTEECRERDSWMVHSLRRAVGFNTHRRGR